jgi:hypothetical protein
MSELGFQDNEEVGRTYLQPKTRPNIMQVFDLPKEQTTMDYHKGCILSVGR